jgi:hypothetical protein
MLLGVIKEALWRGYWYKESDARRSIDSKNRYSEWRLRTLAKVAGVSVPRVRISTQACVTKDMDPDDSLVQARITIRPCAPAMTKKVANRSPRAMIACYNTSVSGTRSPIFG